MARLSFPLRAQPDHGHGALPFQEKVENDWAPYEAELMETLHATARASEGSEREQAINELMVLNELKTFFPGCTLASPEQESEVAKVFRLTSKENPVGPTDDEHQQTTLIPPEGVDSILRMPDSVRARMRGERDNAPATPAAPPTVNDEPEGEEDLVAPF